MTVARPGSSSRIDTPLRQRAFRLESQSKQQPSCWQSIIETKDCGRDKGCCQNLLKWYPSGVWRNLNLCTKDNLILPLTGIFYPWQKSKELTVQLFKSLFYFLDWYLFHIFTNGKNKNENFKDNSNAAPACKFIPIYVNLSGNTNKVHSKLNRCNCCSWKCNIEFIFSLKHVQ